MSLQPYLDEYNLLTPEEKEHVANGCGPKFGFLGSLVPDFCGEYTEACNKHDWLYWSGGPSSARKQADKLLKKDMELANHRMPWYKRWALSWTPRVYYWVVRKIGEPAYHRSMYRRTRTDLQREMRDASIQ